MLHQTDIETLARENVFELIGKEWMLVTAGTPEHFNTMTASWGGIGWLWNRPVAFVFVRPERYTHQFIETNERLTLSFLGHSDAMRQALTHCGRVSGRDHDKVAESELTPLETDNGTVAFAEARLVIEGRKLFKSAMKADDFVDAEVRERWYNDQPGGSFHEVYVLEIEKVLTAE